MSISKLTGLTWIQNNTFKVKFSGSPIDGLEHCVKSVSMPDLTRSAVEEYNNGTWRMAPGRQEVYLITITFWDNEDDTVYQALFEHWDKNHNKYHDDQKFKINISDALRSQRDESFNGTDFEESILDSISGLQWDNSSQNQLVEFTATFKCFKATPA